MKKLILLLTLVIACFYPLSPGLTIKADTMSESTDNTIIEEPQQSELAVWFDENVMPHIFTFVTAFLGTGVVGLILRTLVKKGLSSAQSAFGKASEKLNLSDESNRALQEATNNLNKLVAEKMEELIIVFDDRVKRFNDELDEIQNDLEIEQSKYLETKAKAIALSEKLVELIGGEENEKASQDNNFKNI